MSIFLGLLLLAATPEAPTQASPSPWAPVQFMAGEWAGESDGQPGKGTVKRSYRFVLGGKFLHEQNVSTYPPQPKNEKCGSTSTGLSSVMIARVTPSSSGSSTRRASSTNT